MPLEQPGIVELGQRQADRGLVHRRAELGAGFAGEIDAGVLAVAPPPAGGGGGVEVMDVMLVGIVEQHLIGGFGDHQVFEPGGGFRNRRLALGQHELSSFSGGTPHRLPESIAAPRATMASAPGARPAATNTAGIQERES